MRAPKGPARGGADDRTLHVWRPGGVSPRPYRQAEEHGEDEQVDASSAAKARCWPATSASVDRSMSTSIVRQQAKLLRLIFARLRLTTSGTGSASNSARCEPWIRIRQVYASR
jgi:hypothetical protein